MDLLRDSFFIQWGVDMTFFCCCKKYWIHVLLLCSHWIQKEISFVIKCVRFVKSVLYVGCDWLLASNAERVSATSVRCLIGNPCVSLLVYLTRCLCRQIHLFTKVKLCKSATLPFTNCQKSLLQNHYPLFLEEKLC